MLKRELIEENNELREQRDAAQANSLGNATLRQLSSRLLDAITEVQADVTQELQNAESRLDKLSDAFRLADTVDDTIIEYDES
jgi:hypothetical protein